MIRGYRISSDLRRLTGLCGVIFVLSLAVYAATAQRGVGWQDSGEFQFRILANDYFWISGIARAHPWYILMARLFSLHFPVALQFYAINLFSGLGMSVALVFLGLILWVLTRNVWAVIIAVVTLGLAHMAWWMATIAEVYTWSAAFLMAELFCLLNAIKNEERVGEPYLHKGSFGWWVALALINGVHASLHNFAFLNIPVYVVVFITQHLDKKARIILARILICLAAWLAGAALLIWVFAVEWRNLGVFSSALKSLFFGREFEQVVLGTRAINWPLAIMNFSLASVSLMNPCWLFVFFGWRAGNASRVWKWCLLGSTAVHGLFWVRYFVADQATFVLPVLSLLAIWLGLGVASRKLGTRIRWLTVLVAVLCSVTVPVLLNEFISARHGGVVRSRMLPFRDETRYWLLPWKQYECSAMRFVEGAKNILRDGDVLIADNTAAGPVFAVREAGKLPHNIRIIAFFTGETDDELVRIVTASERVFIVSPVAGYASAKLLDGRFQFEPEGVLYRVTSKRAKAMERE